MPNTPLTLVQPAQAAIEMVVNDVGCRAQWVIALTYLGQAPVLSGKDLVGLSLVYPLAAA